MAKKILITGPESSGKTSLCQQLLPHIANGAMRAEAARPYLEKLDRPYQVEDLMNIWRNQINEEQQLEQQHQTLICDTAHFVFAVWNEVVFQHPSLTLPHLIADYPINYDLILICQPDLPWQPDPLREDPNLEKRQQLFFRYIEMIELCGLDYHLINGLGTKRITRALEILAHSNIP